MNINNEKYKDIINLPHYISKKHIQMSLEARSAQFAALTGDDDVIKETARLTEKRKDIDEGLKTILNNKLKMIQEKINTRPKITFTYFIPDNQKSGGSYEIVTGNVKKIDKYKQIIILENNIEIPIVEIIEIEENI